MLKSYIKLLRPHQYVKNLFIFVPLLFMEAFPVWEKILVFIGAFVAFSMASSCIYVLNDLQDVYSDRKHPKKRNRPIASGAVDVKTARVLLVCLGAVSLVLSFVVSKTACLLIFLYLFQNILYTHKLKHFPFIDVCIISVGFIIRILIGASIAEVYLSHWVLLAFFFLTLFMGLSKRRDDALIFAAKRVKTRRVIAYYNVTLINVAIIVSALLAVFSYGLYIFSTENRVLLSCINVLLLIAGTVRYIYRVFFKEDYSGSPTKIFFKDKIIQASILLWSISHVALRSNGDVSTIFASIASFLQ